MVKRCSNIFIGLKKRLVWVVLDIDEIRDKNNATGLKERRGIKIETTVLSIYAIARSLSLFVFYLQRM